MDTNNITDAPSGLRDATCCASSIPALLSNGKGNPEYRRWYRAKRKAEGRPLGTAEYYREYRKTSKGKSIVKKWNDSEEGKIARKRCRIRKMAKRRPGESDSEYQARFDRCLERMDSLHNADVDAQIPASRNSESITD